VIGSEKRDRIAQELVAASFSESLFVAMVIVCEVEPSPVAGKVTDKVPSGLECHF